MAFLLGFQAIVLSSCAYGFSCLPALSVVHVPLVAAERPLDCCRVERTYRNGSWTVVETANFQVCCQLSEASAKKLAQHAETLRSNLFSKWLGQAAPDQWCPKCKIRLYANQRSYVAAVGRGSERTVGSSLVEADHGKITSRQIDLLEESTDYLSAALPHELTHVVLKDRFANSLPRWADEGMAILADPTAKQQRHNVDLKDAINRQTTFHAAELMLMENYPAPSKFGVFYGQSASLTEFLVSRKTPQQFVEFMDRARLGGFDEALRDFYGFNNVADLDRQWRSSVLSHPPSIGTLAALSLPK